MRFISSTFAAALLAATISLTPTAPAKADGGVLLGTAIYLGADLLVGEKCGLDAFPFNIPTKLGGLLHGRDYCHGRYYNYPAGYGYYHRRHYQHHHRHHY